MIHQDTFELRYHHYRDPKASLLLHVLGQHWRRWVRCCPAPGQGHYLFNTLRPRQNGFQFPNDISKCIFLNENVLIAIRISLEFIPKDPINNIPALVQIMAWRRPGDKPLSEPMMIISLKHIRVTWPQWVSIHVKSFLSTKCIWKCCK